jgi:hypothetical protein
VQHNRGRRGRNKGAVSPARRGLAVGNRRSRGARTSGMGGFRAGDSNSVAGLSGHCPLGWLASRHRRPGGRRPLPFDGTNRGGRERREREGDRNGSGFKLNFSKF